MLGRGDSKWPAAIENGGTAANKAAEAEREKESEQEEEEEGSERSRDAANNSRCSRWNRAGASGYRVWG